MFDRNVFINCPFDDPYRPILDALIFGVVFAGLTPRLATERADGGENRLDKICQLMRESRFSVHDLSRCEAVRKGEIARLNMPFELGVDYGLRVSQQDHYSTKRFLVLDEKPHRLRQALSDINGWDPMAHDANPVRAMQVLCEWLTQEAGVQLPGPSVLFDHYLIFSEWKYGQPDHARADVDNYSHRAFIAAVQRWIALDKPRDPNIR